MQLKIFEVTGDSRENCRRAMGTWHRPGPGVGKKLPTLDALQQNGQHHVGHDQGGQMGPFPEATGPQTLVTRGPES